jgi:uncharacterized membrane protein YkoI
MKRTSMVAAAIGAAAVLGLSGSAMAAADDRPAPVSLKASPSSDDNGRDSSRTPSPSPSSRSGLGGGLTRDEATRAALRATGGGSVSHVEAEYEHGRAVWKVRVLVRGVRHDLDLDRKNGKVTRHDVKKTSVAKKVTATHTKSRADDRGRGRDDKGYDDHGGHGHGHGSDD